jgi:hypothetical protein
MEVAYAESDFMPDQIAPEYEDADRRADPQPVRILNARAQA